MTKPNASFRNIVRFTRVLILISVFASLSRAQSISGTVSGGSAGIAGVTVNVYNTSRDDLSLVASTVTVEGGYYETPDLPSGSYILRTGNTLGYIDEFYSSNFGPNTTREYAVAVAAGSTGIHLSLSSGSGSISGRLVTGAAPDLWGIPGAAVIAYQTSDSTSKYVAWVTTDASGHYTIPGLAPGSFYLKASNTQGYLNEYFDNAEYASTATAVEVTAGNDRAGTDFTLVLGGSITGRVARISDGAGIENVQITARKKMSFLSGDYFVATTNAAGNYAVNGLVPGSYWVQVDASTSGYVSGYYSNGDVSFWDPTAVHVAASTMTPGIDFNLVPGGSISGRVVRDSDGAGVVNPYITLKDPEGNFGGSVSASSTGHYSAKGLRPGSYYLRLSSFGNYGSSVSYTGEFYRDANSKREATAVVVTGTADTPNINLSIADTAAYPNGFISGTVTRESDGANVGYPLIYAYKDTGMAGYALGGFDGRYRISLPPGSYYVRFEEGLSGAYLDEYYDNVAFQVQGIPVTVFPDAETANINFAVSETGTRGSISGTVIRDSDGKGINGVPIDVYDVNWNSLKSVTTDGLGKYYIDGLPPGSYYVATNRVPGYVDEYFNDSRSRGTALLVEVLTGADHPGVDFTLARGGALTGSVEDRRTGTGIEGVEVQVYDGNWDAVASTTTDVSGAFYIDGFDPGSYYLKTSNSAGYVDEYYPNSLSAAGATAVAVYEDPDLFEWSRILALAPVVPAAMDFDGDRKSDLTVWRQANGAWYALKSGAPGSYTVTRWGMPGDVAVPGDYDGDGTPDIAVWWPGMATWYILPSGSPGTYTATALGKSTDSPLPGDYDGDGKTDLAVWRAETGVWYIVPSRTPDNVVTLVWGQPTDVPVPEDYDGDGKTDIAVWRPGTGIWYVRPSESPGKYTAAKWGMPGDKPVPADYDGDGKADTAVWRPSTGVWYLLKSGAGGYTATRWGVSTDIPVPGDYDSDGKADPGAWRPSTGIWYTLLSGTAGYTTRQWGKAGDLPISPATGILRSMP